VPGVKYAMDYRPKNSFSMSYASRKVIFPGAVDQQATTVAYKQQGSYTKTQNQLHNLNYVSVALICWRVKEVKWKESQRKIKGLGAKSKYSYRYNWIK